MQPTKGACIALGLAAFWHLALGLPARGQGAIAFVPIPEPALSGQTMTVTPTVSADRRYVRLSVSAYFNAINGFTNYTAPLGAVSGGGGAGGGGGGLGGLGGGMGGGVGGGGVGGGGVGGGGGGGGIGGPSFDVGMNGVIGDAGLGGPAGFAHAGFVDPFGPLRAGPLPFDDGFGDGRGMLPAGRLDVGSVLPASSPAPLVGSVPDRANPPDLPARPEPSSARVPESASPSDPGAPPVARKSPPPRQKMRRQRGSRPIDTSDIEPVIKPKKKP